jgi:hypothetical protein
MKKNKLLKLDYKFFELLFAAVAFYDERRHKWNIYFPLLRRSLYERAELHLKFWSRNLFANQIYILFKFIVQ